MTWPRSRFGLVFNTLCGTASTRSDSPRQASLDHMETMMRPYRCIRFVAFAACLLAISTVRAADPPRLVPHDAAVYIEVSDASRIVDRLLAPDIVGMLESIPQFQQFSRSDQFAQLKA